MIALAGGASVTAAARSVRPRVQVEPQQKNQLVDLHIGVGHHRVLPRRVPCRRLASLSARCARAFVEPDVWTTGDPDIALCPALNGGLPLAYVSPPTRREAEALRASVLSPFIAPFCWRQASCACTRCARIAVCLSFVRAQPCVAVYKSLMHATSRKLAAKFQPLCACAGSTDMHYKVCVDHIWGTSDTIISLKHHVVAGRERRRAASGAPSPLRKLCELAASVATTRLADLDRSHFHF